MKKLISFIVSVDNIQKVSSNPKSIKIKQEPMART
jgi:hypothetical protein